METPLRTTGPGFGFVSVPLLKIKPLIHNRVAEYLLSLHPHPAWPSLSPPPPSPSSSHHLIRPPPLTLSDLLFANLNTSYNYSYLTHNLGAFLFTSDFNAVITNASCLGGGGHPRPIRHNPLVRLPKLPLRRQHPLLRHRYSRPRRRREVRVVHAAVKLSG